MKQQLICITLLSCALYVTSIEVKQIACLPGMNRCADNSKCIPDKDLCDYSPDCDDYSDESFAMCRKVQEKRHTCSTGQIHHPYNGCVSISDGCKSYYIESFRLLCDEIKDGLKSGEIDFLMKEKSKLKTAVEEATSSKEQEDKLKDLFEHLATSFNKTQWIRNVTTDCPPLYVNINGKCTALFTVAQVTWQEAKQFCESISGTLALVRKMKDYEALLKHLQIQELETNFWIGGVFESKAAGPSSWTWLDGKDITMGAPYWSLQFSSNCTQRGTSDVCYHYSLAPEEHRDGFCLAVDYQFHYYFSDQNCQEKRSPLCYLNEK